MMDQKFATVDNVIQSLRSMYWDCMGREISHLVLAYQEFHLHQPNLSMYETENMGLEGENLRKFCEIWLPNPGADSALDSSSVYKDAVRFAEARYASRSVQYRRARCLLQALGILDIDHVHISMGSSIVGCHTNHPQSDIVSFNHNADSIFIEMLCNHCSSPLRGYFYYECEKGCVLRWPEALYFEYQKKGKTSLRDLPELDQERIFTVPFRLCANCIESPEGYGICERDHLHKYFTNNKKVKGQSTFESRLRDRELQDHGVANPTLRRMANNLVPPSRYANAGPIHFGMMFGPLPIENGVPGTSSGALISRRPLPSLCLKPQEALLFAADHQHDEKTDPEVHIFDDKVSGVRKLHQILARNRQRHFHGSVKKIYGGAFSGHAEVFREGEQEIIECFVETADSFKYLPGKSVAANRKRLFRHSTLVADKVQELFGSEVEIYLQHFANAISSLSTPLRWDLGTNNCQHFTRNLLNQLDVSTLFHRFPINYFDNEAKKQWPYPRYILSFGFDIDTPIALLRPQVRSLIWNFYQKKRDDCDLIEFAEQFRTKACQAPTDTWEILCDEDAISEYDGATRIYRLSMVDALWALPRDIVSILQTGLMRSWARHSDNEGRSLSSRQWVLNRLRLLHQLDIFASLCSGLAATMLRDLGKDVEHLSRYYFPTAEMFGTLHSSEKVVCYHRLAIGFITGRERDWWKREVKHLIDTLAKKHIPF